MVMFRLSFALTVAAVVFASPTLDVRQSLPSAILPSGWAAFGCYSDISSARSLRTAAFTDVSNMTIESCIAFCTPAGYNFAGVEFSRECYCDNFIESPAVPIDASNCNMACTGNPGEICGGPNAITIFQHTTTSSPPPPPPPPPPPVASIKQTVGTFQYKGCFQDRPFNQPRVLGTQLTISGVTAESCTSACKTTGFALAGLQFGQECWCAAYMSMVAPAPDSDCNMVCNADSTELCGAGNRLAVYQDMTATPLDPAQCLTTAILFPGAGGVPDFNFNLQMLPSSGSGTAVLLGTVFSSIINGNSEQFKLSGDSSPQTVAHMFALSATSLGQFQSGFALPPTPGSILLFDFVHSSFAITCAKPNPVGSFGPFIGPPILAVGGHTDLWAVCADPLTPIFSPNSTNGACSSVMLEMVPPALS